MKVENISNDQMIISINELKKSGLSHYKINRLVEQGKLIKLNKKFYENLNYQGDEDDFYYVYAFAPQGVICLLSAASYYHLTTYIPDVIDVAIPRKSKISTLPDWPELRVNYYTNERFNIGIEIITRGKNFFKIYDIEKTVVDIVFYREKVGIEETKEILITYLNRPDRNMNRLIRYAEKLKCSDIMNKYLEVLI